MRAGRPTTSVGCKQFSFVRSGIEYKDEVFAAHQLQYAELKPNVGTAVSSSSYPPDGAVVAIVPPEEARPKPATELIFAPRTKEMNKGFLTFQDEGVTSKFSSNKS